MQVSEPIYEVVAAGKATTYPTESEARHAARHTAGAQLRIKQRTRNVPAVYGVFVGGEQVAAFKDATEAAKAAKKRKGSIRMVAAES